ncbi:MAG TPA: DUF86 domain-containing protein [Halanaerobiales bacterium]|nr:DUF86 domain-containing protein [Halanaerobiales bacterium]
MFNCCFKKWGNSKNYNVEEFVKDKMLYGSTERFLHLTIEALIDIGNHIISDKDLGKVDRYRDIPIVLYKNNYLDENMKDIFIKIIGFRNILVHDYLDIDKKRVYEILNENLSDLKLILQKYANFL